MYVLWGSGNIPNANVNTVMKYILCVVRNSASTTNPLNKLLL